MVDPWLTPVINPVESTEAILESAELKVTTASAGSTVTEIRCVPLTAILLISVGATTRLLTDCSSSSPLGGSGGIIPPLDC